MVQKRLPTEPHRSTIPIRGSPSPGRKRVMYGQEIRIVLLKAVS